MTKGPSPERIDCFHTQGRGAGGVASWEVGTMLGTRPKGLSPEMTSRPTLSTDRGGDCCSSPWKSHEGGGLTSNCISSQFLLHAGVISAKGLQLGPEIPRAPGLRSRLKRGNPGLPSAYRACCRSWVSLSRQWLLVGSLVRQPW